VGAAVVPLLAARVVAPRVLQAVVGISKRLRPRFRALSVARMREIADIPLTASRTARGTATPAAEAKTLVGKA